MINSATPLMAGSPGLTQIGDRQYAAGRVAPGLGVPAHSCHPGEPAGGPTADDPPGRLESTGRVCGVLGHDPPW